MKPVKVKKAELLDTLEANRKTHKEDFEIAWEAFRSRAMENLESKLAALKHADKGTQIDLWVNLEMPQDHSEDYERVIEMLKWEVEDTIQLEERDFRSYVQDQWVWKGQFEMQNVQYTGSTSPSKASI